MRGKDARAGKSGLLTLHRRESPIHHVRAPSPHSSVPEVEQNEEKAPNGR